MTEHYIHVNNINLHYLDFGGNGPLLIMMHGLTANAHAFDGIIEAGLDKHFRILSVDLRGRGLSDHPAFQYRMQDHADDILDMMDLLEIDRAIFCGHSFGGLLGFYLAAHYPKKVEKLISLDAAAKMHPRAAEMLAFRFSKLDIHYPNFGEYLSEVQSAPYNTIWSHTMNSYYMADIRPDEKGGVTPRPHLANIIQASLGVAEIPWPTLMKDVLAPVLLVNAPEEYNLGEPLLPPEFAKDTVALLPNAKMITVAGNHQTMLYEEGAHQICDAIIAFAG